MAFLARSRNCDGGSELCEDFRAGKPNIEFGCSFFCDEQSFEVVRFFVHR